MQDKPHESFYLFPILVNIKMDALRILFKTPFTMPTIQGLEAHASTLEQVRLWGNQGRTAHSFQYTIPHVGNAGTAASRQHTRAGSPAESTSSLLFRLSSTGIGQVLRVFWIPATPEADKPAQE
jgi:hypothetical protein